jgi:glycosyltransferase involved in cell wall biosynthesis
MTRVGKSNANQTQTASMPPGSDKTSIRLSGNVAEHHNRELAARKRVFIVSHIPPLAPRAGNEQHLYRMLCWMLEQGYDIIFALIPHEPIDETVLAEARRLFYRLHIIEKDPPWTKFQDRRYKFLERVRKTVWSLENMDRQIPWALRRLRLFSFDELWCPRHAAEQVKLLIRQYQPQVVIAQYVFMSQCLTGEDSRAVRIIDTHDLMSTRRKHLKNTGIVEYHQALSTEEEALLLRRADVIMTSQDDEAQAVRDMGLKQRVFTIAIDMELPRPARQGLEIPGEVLIIASLNEPNVRGVRGFLEMVWPTVRQEIPTAKLRIAGHVCQKLADYEHDPSITLLGYLKDLSEVYERAQVVVNPVYIGSGLKIKSVEALAYGKPLATWGNGLTGMDQEAPCLMSGHWQGLASDVIELLKNAELRAELSRRSTDYVHKRYCKEAIYRPLTEIIERGCAL